MLPPSLIYPLKVPIYSSRFLNYGSRSNLGYLFPQTGFVISPGTT